MIKPSSLALTVSVLALALSACKEDSPRPGGSPEKPAGSSAAAVKPVVAAPAAPAKPAEDKLVEYDLTKAGDKWKGFVAKLPREGAQVMADGVDGARLATNGREPNPFDLGWAPGKGHLKDVKDGLASAAKLGKLKTTFLVDTADGIEYTNEYDGAGKTYHFYTVIKVGKADYHCYTLPMGLNDEAQFKKHKDACKTLEKK